MIRNMLLEYQARAARRQGNRARDAGRPAEAAAAYRTHLALVPDSFAIQVQLGHMLSAAGDHDGADQAYARAASLSPSDADVLLCWGHARKRAGDETAARDLYARSHAIDGNAHAAYELEAFARADAAAAEARAAELAASEPEPEPEPVPAPFVGRIEHVSGRTVSGMALSGSAQSDRILFLHGDREVGQAQLRIRRSDGEEFDFRTVLDLAQDADVRAVRAFDGAELAGSPFRVSAGHHHRDDLPMAWDARMEVVKPFAAPAGAEIALLITHSRTGALKPHVQAYVAALREEGISVLLIAVTDRPLNLTDAVLDLVAGAVVRDNAGYDFAAWAHAIRFYPEVYGARVLYLLNDSLFGPAGGGRFARLVGRVRSSSADLVGLTESLEYRWHVQTYFLALKPRLLSSHALQRFFGDLRILGDKDAVIRHYELRFASIVEGSGHRVEVLFPSHAALNPTLYAWRELIADGYPFMKLLPFRGVFDRVDLQGWRQVLHAADFDLDLLDATLHANEEEVLHDGDTHLVARSVPWDTGRGRPLKIAFYGPWNYDNGLGSASRGIIAAIRRTGCRLNLHPIKKPFHIHRPNGPAVDVVDFEGPADIAVVHLNPDSWFLLTDEQRHAIRAARRRIGYWVWEMDHIPPAWWHDFSSVDRIWSPSRYCARLFEAQDEAPVDVIPHPVPVLPPVAVIRAGVLAGIGLAADARVLLYVFDGSSYLVRKNPAALIRAFDASELAASGWRLVLKTKHLTDRAEEGRALQALAEGTPGVVLIDRTQSPGEMRALLEVADLYASPHCSEGFGLTIAEAMAAGKPVVATDFGGSTDYLDETSGYPVRAHRWQLEADFGHYTKGGVWAKIDEPALTDALICAAAAVDAGERAIGTAARARVERQLSYDAVGALIAESFDRTLNGRCGGHGFRRLAPSLIAGLPVERGDLTHWVHIEPLEADGTPILGRTNVPDHVPTDRDHWIGFMPSGALLSPLYAPIVEAYARSRPDVSIFYADDIAVETAAPVDQIRLKPEFDISLLAAQDYVGAPVIVRGSALAALGGIRPEMGTAASADLLFRAHAAGMSIARIPEVLLAHPGPRVRATIEDYRAMLAAQPRHADHDVVAGRTPETLMLRRRFDADTAPPVTLLVPTRRSLIPGTDRSYVEQLLEGLAATDWPMDRLTVIVGDDVEGEPAWAQAAWPFTLRRIETPRAPAERFNYAAKMNRLWRLATTEQVVFMNDDLRPTSPGWLRALQTFAVDEGVGGVGARLLFEDGSLQHAGMAPHGMGAAHAWVFRPRVAGTYQDWALVQREWSMVTGALFATRRSLMEQVGGFDEQFSLEFNDTDLCLRLRTLGYRIVCTPDAEMVHVEKASRGETLPPGDDVARFLSRWTPWLDADPSWHPGLDRGRLTVMPRHDGEAWYL